MILLICHGIIEISKSVACVKKPNRRPVRKGFFLAEQVYLPVLLLKINIEKPVKKLDQCPFQNREDQFP